MVVSVGIDVAKDKHDCYIQSSEGEVLVDVFTISNNIDGWLPYSAGEDSGMYRTSGQNKSRA